VTAIEESHLREGVKRRGNIGLKKSALKFDESHEKKLVSISIAMAIVAVMAIPISALADTQTGNSRVTATLGGSLTLTVTPNPYGMGSLVIGDNIKTGVITASVVTNTTYDLSVEDAMLNVNSQTKDSSLRGKMWTGVDSTT
jgi:hypothetical protein